MKLLTKLKSLTPKQKRNIVLFLVGILLFNVVLTRVITLLMQVVNPQMDFIFTLILVGALVSVASSIVCFYLGLKK